MIALKRISAFFIICIFLFASLFANAFTVFATEESSESTTTTTTTTTTTASTTTTTTAPPQNGVPISQVFCYGSNSKLYNQLIKYSELSETYTANVSVPMWMTSLEINIKSVSGAKISIDGTEFSADGSLFTHTIEFDAATKYKTTAYKILIKKDDKQSTLTFNLAQSVFETKLENVYVDSKTAEGTNAEGYKYNLPTGTTSCKIKLKTRSEESVSMGKAGSELEKLELNDDKVFLEKVNLSEGENIFNISVTAPGTTINTTLTITVGEPVVSSDVSSIVSSDPLEGMFSETDTPEPEIPIGTVESEEPEESSDVIIHDDTKKSTSPLIWVLIGVVIAVVIGACIFMIASMGGGNKNRQSANYNRPYGNNMYRPAPAPVRRRDLGRFVDDDYGYDDYYGEPPRQYPEDNYYPNEEYYQDDRMHDDFGRDGYQDRYERQPQRQQYQSQRRGNRNDFDEFYDDYYN